MATQILMPALSPTMTEGTIARWLKKEGDTVSSGDVLAEIETDKATMELEAVDEGVLGKIFVNAGGEAVAVNTPIAVIVAEGEDASAAGAAPAKPLLPQLLPPPQLQYPFLPSPTTRAKWSPKPSVKRCAMRSRKRCARMSASS